MAQKTVTYLNETDAESYTVTHDASSKQRITDATSLYRKLDYKEVGIWQNQMPISNRPDVVGSWPEEASRAFNYAEQLQLFDEIRIWVTLESDARKCKLAVGIVTDDHKELHHFIIAQWGIDLVESDKIEEWIAKAKSQEKMKPHVLLTAGLLICFILLLTFPSLITLLVFFVVAFLYIQNYSRHGT